VQSTETQVVSDESFLFNVRGHDCDILQAALVRCFKNTFGYIRGDDRSDSTLKFKPSKRANQLDSLDVVLTAPCENYPYLEMEESYTLDVDIGRATLQSSSLWGILHGLETFSQIVYQDEQDLYQVNVTQIQDLPRFAHRGVLLDTSRHFLSKKILKRNLDAMSYNKMNVFHWHIVDMQAFPYESRVFPNLSRKGSFHPFTHVYTHEDIAEIIEYARIRGIRVVPEFDTPGHTKSWGEGQPNLLTKCYTNGTLNGKVGPIDPSKNETYTFIRSLMGEVAQVFPDKYIHLGGDEVGFDCWKSNPDINIFMKVMGFNQTYAKLEEFYAQKLLDIVGSLNKGYIVWQEVVDNGVKVKPDTVVEVWTGNMSSELFNVTKKGLRTILSTCWYLSDIKTGADWKERYICEPQNFTGTPEQKELVIGGEFCLWGEYIDGTNLISRGWPRGSAVAERLWSPRSVNNTAHAEPRLEEHRCRMLRRGLAVEPVSGPGFCRFEYESD